MLIVRRMQWDIIHGALVVALLLHVLALFAWVVFASAPEKERPMRVIARVDVVDKLAEVPKPAQTRKPAFKPPPVPRPATTPGPTNKPPGKIGKRGGSPPPGRAGAPVRQEPELPKVSRPLSGPGYPVGHGTGQGSKRGTGSGTGNGQGTGTGDGTGDGDGGDGEGGGGGGAAPPAPPPDPLGYVTFEGSDKGLEPKQFTGTEGNFVFSFRNNSKETLSLKVEGTGGDLYGDQFTGVAPGATKTYQLPLKQGWYTITILERHFHPDYVARLRIDPR